MLDTWKDLRFAVRMFARTPGFTAASVLVLAIGIGAVSVMFSTLNSVALRPLPFEDPNELVWAWGTNETRNSNSMSAPDYWDYREQSNSFESFAAFLVFTPRAIITGESEPERVFSTLVSHNLFSTLGVAPQIGRPFLLEEERAGSDNVVIVSHGFWQRQYGGDRSVVGSSITINGEPYNLVGVMPVDFDYPGGIELWFPIQERIPFAQGRGNNNFFYVGRLRAGVSLEQAQTEVDVIAHRLEQAYPETNESWGLRLVTLHERYFSGARTSLLTMLGLVGLVLLIACANVASLSLARAVARGNEVAVRFSLGAVRSRVIRQLLTESLLVALVGGAVGLGLARFGITALKSFGPASLPRLQEVSIDGTVLAFAFLLALVTSLLFGIVPALKGTSISLAETLKIGGTRGASHGRAGFRNALVVTQVALSLMLMIASGLLVQSFLRLQGVSAGFQVEGVLGAELQLPQWKYGTPEEQVQGWTQVYERVAAIPGVMAVGAIDQVPIRSGGTWNHIYPADRPPSNAAERDQMAGQRRIASDEYFTALGIPILAGRALEPTDVQDSPAVMVISNAMAERVFPGESPLGKDLVLWGQNFAVVGVAADVREFGLAADYPSVFYLSTRQVPQARLQLLVRTAGDPLAIAPALRNAVWEVDRDIPISGFETMQARVSRSLAGSRFSMLLVVVFALVALILASMGLYGVLAYFVRQRNRELGIRVALGAGPGSVIGLVVKRGMTLAAVGILLGLAGGFAGARVLRSFLYDIAPTDILTYSGVSLSLAAIALLACVVPARRATKVDPQEVLRVE
jgi:putative ABC transport system permease protein